MSTSMKILLLGATGYIGGSVLAKLLNVQDYATKIHITVLLRSQEKANIFSFSASKNLTAVVGSLEELDKLAELAENADCVFNCADADNLHATEAILRGLQKRNTDTRVKPILIHTSGTGVLADDAAGMYAADKIYSDLDIQMLESLPPDAPHRKVDLSIIDASVKGYVRAFIILPSTIYGIASTLFTEANVQKNHSLQIPALIEASLARGQGGMVGEGKNLWGNVHITDMVDLYLIIFKAAISTSDVPGLAEGRNGFYFASADEHDLYSVSKTISQVLFNLGKGKSAEPIPFTEKEMQSNLTGFGLGTNSRCRADRSRLLGWKPQGRTQDMLTGILNEVVEFLKGYGKRS